MERGTHDDKRALRREVHREMRMERSLRWRRFVWTVMLQSHYSRSSPVRLAGTFMGATRYAKT